jgi:hypothetical protein
MSPARLGIYERKIPLHARILNIHTWNEDFHLGPLIVID